MIVPLAVMQKEARKKGYAVPHFLGANFEMTLAAIEAAKECGSPLALGFAPEVFAMIPLEYAVPMLREAADRATVPVSIQLEHGTGYEILARAISLGMQSVMFDGSHLPVEENTQKTKEIVKMAHAFGCDVEAELGYVGGSALCDIESKESRETDPDIVLEFIQQSQVDSLAISFGNVHGRYRGEAKLNYALVEKIAGMTEVPLTMHGGSGLTKEQYKKSIEAGISNIHFYTNITLGLWKSLEELAKKRNSQPVYHEICGATIAYFKKEILNIMEICKSAGKA
jgi:fructose-1,6-bisphosphate aldolase, class II